MERVFEPTGFCFASKGRDCLDIHRLPLYPLAPNPRLVRAHFPVPMHCVHIFTFRCGRQNGVFTYGNRLSVARLFVE
jgi:hypothetical protein